MSEAIAGHLLPLFMGTFVPLEIMSLEERGGPTSAELAEARDYWLDMIDRGAGTELFFVEKGKTARTAGMLVRLVACLAFEVGGIEIMGHHFVAYEPEVTP